MAVHISKGKSRAFIFGVVFGLCGSGTLTVCAGQGETAPPSAAQAPPAAKAGPQPGQAEEKKPRAGLDILFKNIYESRLIIRALGLTDDQLLKMRSVQRQFGPSLAGLQREVRLRRFALDEAMFGSEADASQIEQRAKELADVEGQALQMRTRMQFQIRQILTPEQLKTFNDLRSEVKEGIRERLRQRPRALQ